MDVESPITELPNCITKDIDVGTSADIIRLLRQCDAQMFSGWEKRPSIYDTQAQETMEKVSRAAYDILRNTDSCTIILSGCGTSGRLAFLLSQRFNKLAEEQHLKPCYEYIIAGGDAALLTSQEAPEDSWDFGREKLRELTEGYRKVMFFGISCGLSAPFVAGQLEYCMDHPDVFIPVLVGFNPVHLARNTPIKDCNKTFRDVATRLSGLEQGAILNPVVGPEAIAGSSRMKGASATKMLLETMLFKAHSIVAQESPTSWRSPQVLMCYEMICRETYNASDTIAKAVALAGASLQRKGHVYYIGWGSLGKMGIIDASECVPTFSAHFDDVRGFIVGGYGALRNREGEICVDDKVLLDVKDFVGNWLPKLNLDDTVVLIFSDKEAKFELQGILHLFEETTASMVGLHVTKSCADEEQIQIKHSRIFNVLVQVNVPPVCEIVRAGCDGSSEVLKRHFNQCLGEMAVKWVLNAVSTGAHVLKGKVLRGFMIDVKIGNNKLFHRAVDMVSKFAQVDREKALISVLQAIYRTEDLDNGQMTKDVSEHVQLAMHTSMVVPLAVLLATGRLDMEPALDALHMSTTAKVLKEYSLFL